MGPPADIPSERRCPACGALASDDAQWCGQCFVSLPAPRTVGVGTAPPRETSPGDRTSTVPRAGENGPRAPAWPCPACGHLNPIELDDCEACGSSFAALMRSDSAPEIAPARAFRRSLVFPGLGHQLIGRPLDGLARGTLFATLAGMVLIVALSGVTTALLISVSVLYAVAALAVYLGSAWEASRLAKGEPALASSRTLLWGTVGIIMLSVALVAVAAAPATRR